MMRKLFFALVFSLIIFFTSHTTSYAQQPTFGPECSPTPTNPPIATTIPVATPIPTVRPTLPRTGTAGTTITFLGMGSIFIFFGVIALKRSG